MALLIRGSKPDPQRVRTGAPDQQSQGRPGRAHSSLPSSPPARGLPTCRVQEPTRAASRGIPSRESLSALGPQRTGPSPAKHIRVSAFMDVSRDHESTLIERGMGVHLNHPIIAKRGIRDSRPARWESWTPHPSVQRKDDDEAYGQEGEPAPITSIAPRLGGSTHSNTSWRALNADGCRYVRTAQLRSAKTNTSHTDKLCEKTLQEHPHSCKASGATPAGALARPHRTA
jgi:hypothetical protein